jgi:hypothetical protein
MNNGEQSDQMILCKKHPKCIPVYFLPKLLQTFYCDNSSLMERHNYVRIEIFPVNKGNLGIYVCILDEDGVVDRLLFGLTSLKVKVHT